jgi:hypothetical protein
MMKLSAPQHAYASYPELIDDYFARGWTDGLPVVPPTPEAVEAALEYAGFDPDEIIGAVPSWDVVIDAEHVAINAVMAGCKSEYLPVVIAAVGALTQPEQNVHSATATLASNWQAVIVNGPIRNELDIKCDQGCLGPGYRANATIGRAVRLVIRNVMGAIPGRLDRSCFSTPGRYSCCFGENEEASPWVPLSVERGVPPGESAVSVFTTLAPLHASRGGSAMAILDGWASRFWRDHSIYEPLSGSPKDCMVVIGQDHMRVLVEEGWSKAAMRKYLWEKLSVPGRFASTDNPDPLLLGSKDSIHLVAAGGYGGGSQLFTPHVGRVSTQVLPPSRPANTSD